MTVAAVIADSATVSGFLLSGAGCRDVEGRQNFHEFTSESPRNDILEAFKQLKARDDISVVFISKFCADKIRDEVVAYKGVKPVVMEIPSKDDE
ncbi:V-type proton ATPase subunit F [Spironucleus salmonicida]|uniref:V-type proton ATPase subunit F n=1 Tax=Spironucleus salmonicida TaxID=348837 RepID=V6LSW6_9EUKA|nr:V-type proton ATPase subunit F [Spironucleus salmonicida]|eukprot:EST47737.1 V-type proton ATPase subunit F [Spironucleus salmonicida]